MKNIQQQVEGNNSTFTNIPVIRLDSGSVRIPVELIDRVVPMKSSRRVVHIKSFKFGFCASR